MRFVLAALLGLLLLPASAFALAPGDKVTYTTGMTARTGTLLVQTPSLDLVARTGTTSTQDQVASSVVYPVATPTPTPTATPTGTPTPTPSPTATPTATPNTTPTPTPTPTPTGSFPDAANTGVPLGTPLSPYAGPNPVTQDGAVIDGKTLGCVEVRAANVIIERSHISCNHPQPDAVANYDGTAYSVTVQDSEIDCQAGPGTAFGDHNITALRDNIWGCENGGDIDQGITVQDSYIHDLWANDVSHTDGFQTDQHLDSSGDIAGGTVNVTIRHNTIFATPIDATNSAIITYPTGDRNLIIDNNLMGGGGYTLYCPDGSNNTGIQVTDNHFTTRFGPKVGFYGPGTGCDPARVTVSGNVIDETGAPADLR